MTATYEELRLYRNKINRFARHVSIETIELGDGYARTKMIVQPEFENTIGSIHGGAIFTLADTATGAAAASDGSMHTTADCSMYYLRPCIGIKTLYAVADRMSKDEKMSVYDVQVVDENDRLYARGVFSYFNLNKPLMPE